LLKELTKTVLETALEGELADHLRYDEHDPAGRSRGNSRNGYRSKTVLTDSCGEVTIEVPRDRDGSFANCGMDAAGRLPPGSAATARRAPAASQANSVSVVPAV
jgi:hypothetical protein